MSYATEDELKIAEALGYTVECSQKRGHRFHRGSRWVWSIYRGEQGPLWQTADIGDQGWYINHQAFERLEDALRRPLP